MVDQALWRRSDRAGSPIRGVSGYASQCFGACKCGLYFGPAQHGVSHHEVSNQPREGKAGSGWISSYGRRAVVESNQPLTATCPECRGPLTEVRNDKLREYRCLVGHAYSARSLLQAHSEAQERVLWSAVVSLEESAVLVEAAASAFPSEVAGHLRKQAEKKLHQASEIRLLIEHLEPFRTELVEIPEIR
jgi:hypothetical protein